MRHQQKLDLIQRILASDPETRVQDGQGVDFGPNCVTLNSCASANLCNGTCKLF